MAVWGGRRLDASQRQLPFYIIACINFDFPPTPIWSQNTSNLSLLSLWQPFATTRWVRSYKLERTNQLLEPHIHLRPNQNLCVRLAPAARALLHTHGKSLDEINAKQAAPEFIQLLIEFNAEKLTKTKSFARMLIATHSLVTAQHSSNCV